MARPMQRVSTLISKDIGDYLTNRKAWGPVMYNVLEHGLKGDGVTDDTEALQELINLAISEGRKAIFFPHTITGGEYYVTSLSNANQAMFFGDNTTFAGGYAGDIRQLGDLATSEQLADMLQEANEIVTVGLGGDFATINEALDYFSKRHVKYLKSEILGTIRLLSGFVMDEQVFVSGMNLGWVVITSEDEEVIINRDALKDIPRNGFDCKPAFAAMDGAVLPTIGALFNMNTTGDGTNRDGIIYRKNSSGSINQGCGVKNAGRHGLLVDGGSVDAYRCVFSGSGGSAAKCFHGASVQVRDSDLTGAGIHGIHASDSTIVAAHEADCSNAAERGVWAESNSQVSFQMGTANDCGGNALEAVSGSSISARDGSFINAGADGIHAIRGGTISAQRSLFSGAAGVGCFASGGSTVSIGEAKFIGCNEGIYATAGSKVDAAQTDCSNSITYGVRASASYINFEFGNANNAGNNGIYAIDGANINARAATANVAGNDGISAAHGSMINIRDGSAINCTRHGILCNASTVNARGCTANGGGSSNHINVSEGGIIQAVGAIGTLGKTANVVTTDGLIIQ